jgi:mitochondrial Rho GTPase 1
VGNKLDLRTINSDSKELEEIVSSLCREFEVVEIGMECSAKLYVNIIDAVYCAQRAVLFPIAPIFDSISKVSVCVC